MAKTKKQTKKVELIFPAYLGFNLNLDAEIHSILGSLREHINTKEIDIQSATELIQEHLNQVISDVLEELNEDLLVVDVINYKEVA